MIRRPFSTLVFAAILGALSLGPPPPAAACAPAPREGATVAIADESAIIVWDEAKQIEHFVRRASFRSSEKDFGFLVPTPTKPDLTEVSDDAFTTFAYALRPDRVERHSRTIELTALFVMFFSARKSASMDATAVAPPPVRVLEEKRVAGYDAVVLEADDAGALEQWLKEHGYARRPALAEWLQPYVQKRWKLTAFKVADTTSDAVPAPGGPPQVLGTRAVRMSFATERPFFPYREPRDQRESLPPSLSAERSLRVYFVGPKRVTATIGDGSTAFPGTMPWAVPFAPIGVTLPVPPPSDAWLTVFQDDASPRPGVDELWFDAAKDQSIVKPPPMTVDVKDAIPIPVDLLIVLGIVGVSIRRAVKRTRKR